jgi:guanylate kinase
MTIRRRGFLLVLSSPSGAGKTTITRRLVERDPCLRLSVSVTTRPSRAGEVDGRDYFFIDRPRFDEMVEQGELLEHAIVFDNCYGTPRRPIEEALAAGRDVVGDLDWQGTQQLSESVRQDLVTVFVLPPSRAELEIRLRARAQDSPAAVAGRMAKAAEEMSHWSEYEYVIVNVDIEDSVAQVQAIVTAERLRRERQLALDDWPTLDILDGVAEEPAIVAAERLRREQQLGLDEFVNHLRAA